MSSLTDAPRTPPGFPPGSAPTQGPYPTPTGLAPPPGFDSARLQPGLFDLSSWPGEGSSVPDAPGANGDSPPAIVDEARALVLRYRRASWRAEAVAEPARRLATRALRETRDALASGLTIDGVRAASTLLEFTVEADPTADSSSGSVGANIADASAAMAASAAAARRALSAAQSWPDDVVIATLDSPGAAGPQAAPPLDLQGMLNAAASAAAAAATQAAPSPAPAAAPAKLPEGATVLPQPTGYCFPERASSRATLASAC